jgi:probable F420-dependent oxidoreductase
MTGRPLRFALVHSSPVGADWPARVREASDLGYGTLFVTDHLDGQPAPGPALGMAAALAPALRVGTLVYCNDLHNPVVLAREAMTLAHLSDGRFELGVGAGWDPRDYAASGVPFDRPGVRVERLAESLGILRRCLRGEAFAHSGEHYAMAPDVPVGPVPAAPPPLLVGGGGPRLLAVAGTYADIVSLNPRLDGAAAGLAAAPLFSPVNDAAGTRRKLGWVADAAGDRMASIELSATVYEVVVTDDRDAAARSLARAAGADVEHVLSTPHAAVGTHRQIADDLLRRRDELGISYFAVDEWHRHAMAPVVAAVAGR